MASPSTTCKSGTRARRGPGQNAKRCLLDIPYALAIATASRNCRSLLSNPAGYGYYPCCFKPIRGYASPFSAHADGFPPVLANQQDSRASVLERKVFSRLQSPLTREFDYRVASATIQAYLWSTSYYDLLNPSMIKFSRAVIPAGIFFTK